MSSKHQRKCGADWHPISHISTSLDVLHMSPSTKRKGISSIWRVEKWPLLAMNRDERDTSSRTKIADSHDVKFDNSNMVKTWITRIHLLMKRGDSQIGIEISNYTGNKISEGVARSSRIGQSVPCDRWHSISGTRVQTMCTKSGLRAQGSITMGHRLIMTAVRTWVSTALSWHTYKCTAGAADW